MRLDIARNEWISIDGNTINLVDMIALCDTKLINGDKASLKALRYHLRTSLQQKDKQIEHLIDDRCRIISALDNIESTISS